MEEKRTYRFVEVPLVGYVLSENAFMFGYKEYFSAIEYDVHLYVTEKKNASVLEDLIGKELTKGKMKQMTEGMGSMKKEIYWGSRMGSIFIALSLEENSLMKTILPLILVPGPVYPLLAAYVFKRWGEKCALEKMKERLHRNVFEYDASGLQKKISELQVKEKIQDYATLKKQGGFCRRWRRIWKLEPEIEAKRQEVAKDLNELLMLSRQLIETAEDKIPYETIIYTYTIIHDIYNYTWWQKGAPVMFGR